LFIIGIYDYMKIIITESQFDKILLDKMFLSRKEIKQNEFISKSQNIHKDSDGNPLYDYSLVDYDSAQSKVKIICPRHKQEWKKETGNEYFEMTPNHHLSGRGCKFDYLEKKLKYSDKDIEDSAKKYRTAIEFKQEDFAKFNAAVKRGREFYEKISSHFVGAKESYGEKLITDILVNNGLISEKCVSNPKCENRQKKFEGCLNRAKGEKFCFKLSFDFYLPNENTLIEYDGEQHFSSRGLYGKKIETLKRNDLIKNEYCKDNNIKLIRVHYKVPISKVEGKLLNALKSPEQEIFIGPYSKSPSQNKGF
jgi:hypothetical protein